MTFISSSVLSGRVACCEKLISAGKDSLIRSWWCVGEVLLTGLFVICLSASGS